jgi:uncharacterized protein (DUF1501 family)
MTMSSTTRRALLQRMSALSAVGAAGSTFGLQMATLGEAAAQTAPGSDYRALVCIFLNGGNDSNNTILATDSDSWGRYIAARQSIALSPVGAAPSGGATSNPSSWGGVLPLPLVAPNPIPAGTNASVRTIGLHPVMSPLVPIWQSGRLAIQANVGPLIQPTLKSQYLAKSVRVPDNLGSHNDQQSTWQSGLVEGARRGWAGLMADLMLSGNGANSAFTAISMAGNAVWLAGQNVVQYQMGNNAAAPAIEIEVASQPQLEIFGGPGMGARIRDVITDTSGSSYFMKDYAAKTRRAIDAAGLINAQFGGSAPGASIPAPGNVINPITLASEPNQLALQLRTVAKTIAANRVLGLRRQIFFLTQVGYDLHSTQNTAQPPLLARLAHAMAYFDSVLGNVNGVDMRSQVTTFTASDFSRTFSNNGDGTDHAWGAHHFMMGGAVRGGRIYGQFPTLGIDSGGFNNPDIANSVMIPTTSVDQYASTFGKWFGVADGQLDAILPSLRNYSPRDLGFLA